MATFCALLPFFWFGIPSGHDFEFHLNSWIEVLAQWKQGIIYPHWSALAHFGYGEARFIFYPPVSWTLGAALGAILPWKFVSFTYNWVALTLAGASMWVAARRWLAARDSRFAAVFYAVNPYFLVIVYWRSAMAELLAAAYIPLLFMYGVQLGDDDLRVIAPLGLLIGAGWLTNIPSAVMMVYSLGVLAVWAAVSRKSWKPLLRTTGAVGLGLAISGVYLLPVWHQKGWVALDQVISPGVRPLDNFLFSTTIDREHNLFNHVVSVVAACEAVILAFALGTAYRKRTAKIWWPLFLWGSLCIPLLFKFTLPLWNYAPELRYVQFPWRWLLVLNVSLAFTIVLAPPRWWLRIAVSIVLLGSVGIAWHNVQQPWWDNSADIQEMVHNEHDGIGNDGTDEYVPIAADSYDVNQNAPLATYTGTGSATIVIQNWQVEHRAIEAEATAPGNLVIRLFSYPLWRVEVNGRSVQSQTTEDTGLIKIPIAAGQNRIEIRWTEGWDRKVGAIVSLLGLLATFAIFLGKRPTTLNIEGEGATQ